MYTASGSKAYAQIGVESAVMSASQQQLVTMLFDGVLSALVRARLFMQDNNQQGKGVSLSKAINIIENGLRVSLDEESKDELTQNLIALYSYMVRRLLQANLRNDVSEKCTIIFILCFSTWVYFFIFCQGVKGVNEGVI